MNLRRKWYEPLKNVPNTWKEMDYSEMNVRRNKVQGRFCVEGNVMGWGFKI